MFRTARLKSTLVTIHGAWHGPEAMEKNLGNYFRRQFQDIIHIQLPGHGNDPFEPSMTLGKYVEHARQRIREIEGPKVILGHSMGGLILEKYLQNPDCSSDAAIFLAPVPTCGVVPMTGKFLLHPKFFLRGWRSLLSTNLYHMVDNAKKVKEIFFSEDQIDEEIEACQRSLSNESFLVYLQMLLPRPILTPLNTNRKLVIAAENDVLFRLWEQQLTAWQYGADFRTVPTAHNAMLDREWKTVAHLIDDWLEGQNELDGGIHPLLALAS